MRANCNDWSKLKMVSNVKCEQIVTIGQSSKWLMFLVKKGTLKEEQIFSCVQD
jgi:hypothetical protein